MATAQELFGDYNFYRIHTKHIQELRRAGRWITYLKETAERLTLLAQMAFWCGERGYESRHWLCWLFYRNKWLYARRFDLLIPTTPKAERKLHAAYREVGALEMYERRVRQSLQAQQLDSGQIYDARRDMAGTTEALKRRYLRFEDPEGCLEDERTNGYHPRSMVCGQCSLAQACEQRLRMGAGFDIVALRDGRTMSRQARLEAYHRGK